MSEPSPRPGRRTGPKPSFHRRDVLDAAISLGLDKFTLGEISRRLQVTQSALYRLFDSRDAVLQACLAEAAAAIRWPDPTLPWPDQLRAWARSVWEVCEQYPGLDQTLLVTPGIHAHIQAGLAGLRASLEAKGLSLEKAEFVISLLGDVMLTSHIRVVALRGDTPDGEPRVAAANRWLAEASSQLGMEVAFPFDPDWLERFVEDRLDFVIEGCRD